MEKMSPRFYDRQIPDPYLRLIMTAYAGSDPHEIDRRAYTYAAGNKWVVCRGESSHSLASISRQSSIHQARMFDEFVSSVEDGGVEYS